MLRILESRVHCVDESGHALHYIDAACLSTDTKPTTNLVTGSRLTEVDTGAFYRFDEASGAWVEQTIPS